MSKFVLLILALLAVVVLVPSVRERARPQVEAAMNPMYVWNVRNEVKELQHVVTREVSMGNALPKPRDFQKFLVQREGEGSALDSWGQPYYLQVTRRSYLVGSSGPDRRRNTADDIRSEPAMRNEPANRR